MKYKMCSSIPKDNTDESSARLRFTFWAFNTV